VTSEDEHMNTEAELEAKDFPATIAEIIDDYTLVMNRGSRHGVKNRQKFLIYGTSDEEIIDPETGKTLGFLEIVRGIGTISHVQENISTISAEIRFKPARTIRRKKTGVWGFMEPEVIETVEDSSEVLTAFKNAQKGDKARPV